jgi:hypothetical protein
MPNDPDLDLQTRSQRIPSDTYPLLVAEIGEPSDDPGDPGPPPPGWVSVEELGEQIMLEQLSRSTARALIELLAERRDSPDALVVALLAVIFQVQEQVDAASKELLSYVLGAVPPINSLFVDSGGSYPITEDLWLRRLLDADNQFTLAAPRQWLEPMGLEIQQRLERWAGSIDEHHGTTEPG